MSAYTYLTDDMVVARKPVRLLSVVVTTDGTGPGKVVLYDGRGAETGHEVATLLCGGNLSMCFRWTGLELTRGLYVDIVEKADYVTVEWEPVGYEKEQAA